LIGDLTLTLILTLELLVAKVSIGKSHITLTVLITKVNYVFPAAVPVYFTGYTHVRQCIMSSCNK